VAIKEGWIGSVRAKIPWKVLTTESCEIEVDELKLVIGPRPQFEENDSSIPAPAVGDDLRFAEGSQHPLDVDTSGLGATAGGAYMGVDDGVRMIAKMVERVLLGLRVKVSKLIIVFEEQVESVKNGFSGDVDIQRPTQHVKSPHSLLIVRVECLDYGVEGPQNDLEETVQAMSGTEPGLLVKVVKFKGATVEVVEVEDEVLEWDEVPTTPLEAEFPGVRFLGQPVFILVGESGGLAGSIQLSVPWRDGIVDVPKVHADISISAVKLKVSPRQIKQLLDLIKAFGRDGESGACNAASGPVLKSSMWSGANAGNFTGSRFRSAMAPDRNNEFFRSLSGSMASKSGRGMEGDPSGTSFLPVTRFISDWMHWAGTEGQRRDGTVAEADLAARYIILIC
jgi:autophagy-related protein 2